MSEDTVADGAVLGEEEALAIECIWCDVPAGTSCVRLNTDQLREAPHAIRVRSAVLVAQARADGAAEERERIARYALTEASLAEDDADVFVLDQTPGGRQEYGLHAGAGRAFRKVARFTGWRGPS